jgi:hypothetical protein
MRFLAVVLLFLRCWFRLRGGGVAVFAGRGGRSGYGVGVALVCRWSSRGCGRFAFALAVFFARRSV